MLNTKCRLIAFILAMSKKKDVYTLYVTDIRKETFVLRREVRKAQGTRYDMQNIPSMGGKTRRKKPRRTSAFAGANSSVASRGAYVDRGD